jgi:hypothetical protein
MPTPALLMPVDLVEMIFILLLIMMGGGFVLLYPLSRQIGRLLQQRLEQNRAGPGDAQLATQLAQIRAELAALRQAPPEVPAAPAALEPPSGPGPPRA